MPTVRTPTVSVQDRVTVVALGPEYDSLDGHGLDDIREALLQIVGSAEPPQVVLDMSHTTFFGSAFIEVLFKAWNRLQARGGELVMSGLQPHCKEVIEITNLDKLWKITPNSVEAVAYMKGRRKPPE